MVVTSAVEVNILLRVRVRGCAFCLKTRVYLMLLSGFPCTNIAIYYKRVATGDVGISHAQLADCRV